MNFFLNIFVNISFYDIQRIRKFKGSQRHRKFHALLTVFNKLRSYENKLMIDSNKTADILFFCASL